MTLDIKLGKYTLLEKLGRGGYGTVYRARDDALHVERAVKVLHPALVADPEFIERFRDEARLVARLKHPHIAPVYDLDEDQGRIFLAMEYMPGGSLKDVLMEEGPLPFERALEILRQVASALDYAHQQDLVHRDVKPGNILFDGEGTAYLTDFGFAKSLVAADSSTTMSLTGGILGTPAYMSPEAWDGKGWAPTADVYSLACVFVEMLTGKPLFDGVTPTRIMKQHIIEGPQFPEEWPEGVPAGVENVLVQALAQEPQERFASVEEFVEEVSGRLSAVSGQEVAISEQQSAISDQPSADSRQLKADRSLWQLWYLWAGLASVAVIIGLIIRGFPLKEPEQIVETVVAKEVVVAEVTSTPTTELGIGSTQVSEVDNMVTVYIPAGEFEMGDANGFPDESPVHTVYTDAFWMDQSEVTNAMFAAFLNEQGNQSENGTPWLYVGDGDVNIEQSGDQWQLKNGYEVHPVIEVSWYGAQAYCEWAGRRLPTEAEWEKAARGGLVGKRHPWGDEDPVCTTGALNGVQYRPCDGTTVPVMTFASNGYGLYDVAGNVWEWVADWSDTNYYGNSPLENPKGPNIGSSRVLRGGSWSEPGYKLRSAGRNYSFPETESNDYGFRCARSAASP